MSGRIRQVTLIPHKRQSDPFWKLAPIVVCVAAILGPALLLSHMKNAGAIVRRIGWIPPLAALLLIATLVVPQRRWGRARWLPWALIFVACAAEAFHVVSASVCRGLWRDFGIPILVILSALSAVAAIYEAIGERTHSADPGPATKIAGTPTDMST
jgi:hypothetical protein